MTQQQSFSVYIPNNWTLKATQKLAQGCLL